ncbi:hypothetical protein OIU34_17025 [Pararhizobium sp. BT-229]|uniref:hypothetical protein n=1 Tax=Pararhizobium sp. BT-229 TaxID=2986923 RepID=UPI0021F7B793|nr:hypothetical protein [Pararhizobium sp. BT-229]MCV9963604.1 hypothetical protein [Pararhizobium sp. BT-229]
MRGKYSPTIVERDLNPLWWAQNGGGYGLLDDGSQMSDAYHQFDHEGYDRFGYNERGIDRADYTVRDYQVEELYTEVLTRGLPHRYSKSVSDYWHAVMAIADSMNGRFPDLAVVDPQGQAPSAPHIAVHVVENGGYGIRLVLEDADGSPRSLDVVFDAVVDPNRPADRWSVNVTARSGGETRRTGRQSLPLADALEFARDTVSAYDPDRRLYDVLIVESGDGHVYLDARHRSERANGDILGSVYASDHASAIETLARRYQPGGTVQRMASRGLRRLGAELPSVASEVSNFGPGHPDSGGGRFASSDGPRQSGRTRAY